MSIWTGDHTLEMSVGSVGVLVGSHMEESFKRTPLNLMQVQGLSWFFSLVDVKKHKKTLQRCWLVVSEFDNCWDSQALKDDATLSKCYRGGCLHERNARLSWVRAKFISENRRFCWELVVTCWLKILHPIDRYVMVVFFSILSVLLFLFWNHRWSSLLQLQSV